MAYCIEAAVSVGMNGVLYFLLFGYTPPYISLQWIALHATAFNSLNQLRINVSPDLERSDDG